MRGASFLLEWSALRWRRITESLEEPPYCLDQGGDLVARHIPDDGIIHGKVGVSQSVPETGEAPSRS